MAADPETQRWWALMEPMQEKWPTAAPAEWWSNMTEVFHARLRRHDVSTRSARLSAWHSLVAPRRYGANVRAHLGFGRQPPHARLVERREVRHLHSLGRVFGAGLCAEGRIRRVVLGAAAQARQSRPGVQRREDPARDARVSRTRLRQGLRVPDFAPQFTRRDVRRRPMGGHLPALGREIRGDGLEAPRRVRAVAFARSERELGPALECGRCRAATRPRRRAHRRRARAAISRWVSISRCTSGSTRCWLAGDADAYVERHLFPQFKDLVTRYSPSVIFSDGEWELPSEKWRAPELLAWLFNDSPVAQQRGGQRSLGRRVAPQARRLLHHRIRRGLAGRESCLGRESRPRPFLWLQPQRRPRRLRQRDRSCC